MVIFLTDARNKHSTLGRSHEAGNNVDRAVTTNIFGERIDARSGTVLELFARFIRSVAGKTQCWSAVAGDESEKKYCAF